MIIWEDCPIDPSWITYGAPAAMISPIASDGTVSTGYWKCTEGGFVWRYDVDETIVLMSGVAIIDGIERSAGSTVQFARGTTAAWEVIEPVTKLYVIQTPMPWARRVVRKLRGLVADICGKRSEA